MNKVRLIDANALKDIEYINKGNFNTVEGIREWIDNAPTVDLWEMRQEATENALKKAEVLYGRPQGEWIDYSDEGYVECPFCQSATTCEDNIDELHYCWNCGAYLKKGGAE